MPSAARRRSRKSRSRKKAQPERKGLFVWCFGPPPVLDEEPLMTLEEFRQMHRRRQRSKQLQCLKPVHWLHPRAVMLQVLYDSLMADPYICNNIPPRLLDLLEFHKTMILYDDDSCFESQFESDEDEVQQEAADVCEPDLEEEGAVIADKEEVSSEPVQSLSRRASSGTAACRLENDFEQPITVEEAAGPEQEEASAEDELEHHMEEEQQEELEEPAPEPEEEALDLAEEEPFTSPREDNAREGDDASSCDEGAFHALLGSNPHPKPVRRCVDDYKRSASPKRHGVGAPVIKITATSSSGNLEPAIMYSVTESRDDIRRRYRNDALRWTAAASGKFAAKTADRASEAAKTSAAAAAAAAFEVENRTDVREDMSALLDTMSTETGERNAAAAQGRLAALETVIEDTEAELARVNRSKVANMVKMYQNMEESNSRHTSPRIGARKSPLPSEKLKSEPLIPKHPLAVPDSPSQLPAAKAYTSRYLSAVQAATNTVSSWLMNGGNSDEVPSPVAAAAEQLRDEDMCQPKREVVRPLPFSTPAKQQSTETLTFSTPSAQLYDTNPLYDDVHERILWSPLNSSFSSDYGAFGPGGAAAAGGGFVSGAAAGRLRRSPELAARHAAAAARHAAAAARHANAAAKFAGLKLRASPNRRRSHAGNLPHYRTVMDTQTTMTDNTTFPESIMATVDNVLFEP